MGRWGTDREEDALYREMEITARAHEKFEAAMLAQDRDIDDADHAAAFRNWRRFHEDRPWYAK